MKIPTFGSALADEFQSYIDMRFRTTAWNTWRIDYYHLSSLDKYLTSIEFDGGIITQKMINDWLKLNNIEDDSANIYIKNLRGFLEYLSKMGKAVYFPPYKKKSDLYIPHFFSQDEMKSILDYADSHAYIERRSKTKSAVNIEMAMLIRLLYCCGLRLGEALSLRYKDVDFREGILKITKSKRNKQRFVPMHDTLTTLLYRYCKAMGITVNPDAPLFPGRYKDKPLSEVTTEKKFHIILGELGIVKGSDDPKRRGPCLHCLRHSFILESFRQLESLGYSVDMSNPYLSVYCGHESLIETEKYMKFSSEMFINEMNCFDNFSSALFPEVIL